MTSSTGYQQAPAPASSVQAFELTSTSAANENDDIVVANNNKQERKQVYYQYYPDEDLDVIQAASVVELEHDYGVPTSKQQQQRQQFGIHSVTDAWKAALPNETRNLTWSDDYFEEERAYSQFVNSSSNSNNDDDIVAVFDFDFDAMETYYSRIGWSVYGGSAVCLPNLFGIATLAMVPCYLNKNVQWSVRANHVCITRDGIRYVQAKRPTCWGATCTTAGKRSKTIPFDQITDCDIVEPAGNTCLVIPNTLYQVHIDTASCRRGGGDHELTLTGLKDPFAFKKLVWAMKRYYSAQSMHHAPPPEAAKEATTTTTRNQATTELLREIRDELRSLRTSNNSAAVAAAAAAAESLVLAETVAQIPPPQQPQEPPTTAQQVIVTTTTSEQHPLS